MNFECVTEYLNTLEDRYQVHGLDCKVMKDHQTVYRHMTGHSDYDRKMDVSENDLYDIYSASKILTMVGVMQLIEQGKLSLDDPVSKYLPEYGHLMYDPNFELGKWPFKWPTKDSDLKEVKNKVLIHELMSMTAGLTYDTTSESILEMQKKTDYKASTREMVRAIAENPLIFEPGTRYAYSLGHDVLAAVVEVISGMTFGEYMKKNLYEPLGIKDIYYQLTEWEEKRLSAQYACDFETGEVKKQPGNSFRLSKNYESGGAGVTTTVDEYIKVLDALACDGIGATGNRILKPESIKMIGTNRLNEVQLKDFKVSGKIGYGYGLGVRVLIEKESSKSPVGEFGWDGAAGAYALVDPVNHISIFYAQQVLGMLPAFHEIHPTLRDLVYEAMEA